MSVQGHGLNANITKCIWNYGDSEKPKKSFTKNSADYGNSEFKSVLKAGP